MGRYGEGIKGLGVEEEYTPEQIQEIIACTNDMFHFLTYVKIVHPDKGLVTFEPWDYQRDLIKLINNNRFIVALVARQQGKSILVAAYILWYSIFNSNKTVGVVSNNEEGAIDILDRIKVMYEELPDWLKPGIAEYNKKTITFENNTKIRARATSKDSFRGRTLNLVFADEFAFVSPPNKCDEFFTSNWPTISASKESKFIIVSTPKGIGNLFHQIYSEAENGINTFKHFFANYTSHPDRDEEWAIEQRKNLGDRRFNQEYSCSFLGSESTLIDETILKELLAQEKVSPISTDDKGYVRIYETPIKNEQYIMGVDTAKGTGEHYSAIQIFKVISSNPIQLEQVCVYENNTIDVYSYASVVNKFSILYNDAYIMCENNAEGAAIVSQLWWEFENENLVCEGTKTTSLGIRATRKTKPIANLLMKKLVEDRMIKIVDYRTIQQFLTFLDMGNNRFSGNGSDDDLISAFYWACYFFEFDLLEESSDVKRDETETDDIWGMFHDNMEEENEYDILVK